MSGKTVVRSMLNLGSTSVIRHGRSLGYLVIPTYMYRKEITVALPRFSVEVTAVLPDTVVGKATVLVLPLSVHYLLPALRKFTLVQC